jgi:hypothetical protein
MCFFCLLGLALIFWFTFFKGLSSLIIESRIIVFLVWKQNGTNTIYFQYNILNNLCMDKHDLIRDDNDDDPSPHKIQKF